MSESRHRRNFESKQDYIPTQSSHSDNKRGVNIEVKVATKRPNLTFDLLKELEKELKNKSYGEEFDNDVSCPDCQVLAADNKILKEKPKRLKMRPAYACDDWDAKTRTCWLDRNIGDTVTFVLAFDGTHGPYVQWKQEFYILHSKKKKHFTIDPENPLWNIVIGSRGHELRLSPITEIDIDDNSFSAHVVDERVPLVPSLNFRIRIMPIDQGFVYPGETLIFNMKRISLPPTSMIFKWYLENEGVSSTLPSNMKLSPSGSVLTISELRKEQEGILTCSVFTNKGFFATKQRFLIKEMDQNNNLLLFFPTRPPIFNEKRQRRRKRREIDSSDYIDQSFENLQKKNPRLNVAEMEQDEIINHNKQANPYSIQNIDVYQNKHDYFPDREPVEQSHSFREQPLHSNQDYPLQQGQPHSGPPPYPNFRSSSETFNHKPFNFKHPPHNNDIFDGGNIVLEIERQPLKSKIQAQDELSQLISWCNTNAQCSIDANCIIRMSNLTHFCKCNPGYQGNGIFCWEDLKRRNLGNFEEDLSEPETTEQIFTELPNTERTYATY